MSMNLSCPAPNCPSGSHKSYLDLAKHLLARHVPSPGGDHGQEEATMEEVELDQDEDFALTGQKQASDDVTMTCEDQDQDFGLTGQDKDPVPAPEASSPLKTEAEQEEDRDPLGTEPGHLDCPACGKGFRSQNGIREHVTNVHQFRYRARNATESGFACVYCDEEFAAFAALEKHAGERHADGHECCVCAKRFKTAKTLRVHKRKVHRLDPEAAAENGQEGWLKCAHCEDWFDAYPALLEHARRAHSRKHACSICPRAFDEPVKLRSHERNAHRARRVDGDLLGCVHCAQVYYDYDALRRHQASDHADLFVCGFCDDRRSFSSKNNLRKHLAKRHCSGDGGGESYACRACGLRFSDAAKLRSHERDVHKLADNDALIMCFECGETLASYEELEVHVIVAHAVSFECRACGRSFQRRASCRNHEAEVHGLAVPDDADEGKKVLQCGVCDASFGNDSEAFLAHSMEHEVRWRNCRLCSRCFDAPTSLVRHEADMHNLRHSAEDDKFCCKHCPLVFGSSEEFVAHSSQEHPAEYVCSLCNMAFPIKHQLTRHKASAHADRLGGKSFGCHFCDESFRSALLARKHMRKKHGQNNAASNNIL